MNIKSFEIKRTCGCCLHDFECKIPLKSMFKSTLSSSLKINSGTYIFLIGFHLYTLIINYGKFYKSVITLSATK